jgi:hypothetical protein
MAPSPLRANLSSSARASAISASLGAVGTPKGLGAALQTRILNGLAMRSESYGKRHLHRAAELFEIRGGSPQGRNARPYSRHTSWGFPPELRTGR